MSIELRDAYRNFTVVDNAGDPLGTVTAQAVDANIQFRAGFGIQLSVDPSTNKVTIINTGPGAGALTTIIDQNSNAVYYPIFTRPPGPGDINPVTLTYQMDTMYLDQTTTPLTYNPGTATLTVANINAPTITGHPTIEGVTSTGATGTGKFVFDTSPTISGPTITGNPTIQGVTSTGATGTGKFVFDTSPTMSNPTITGHPNIEGVTSTGATGTGDFVFASNPTLITPALGIATATSINKMAITAPATSSTLAVADGKTFTVNNTITFNGTDSTTITLPASNGTVALNNQQFFIGTTEIAINRSTAAQTLTGVSIDGNAATVTNGIYSNQIYNNPSWIGSLTVSQGGTGATDAASALDNLLPSGEVAGYILKTSGPGTYFWAAETGASTIIGTQIITSRVLYTATEGQVLFTGTGSYTIGAGQLRVYIDGVRQFPGTYEETSTSSFTLTTGVPAGTKVLAEVDANQNYAVAAVAVTFSSAGTLAATNVQTALEELDTEKAPKASPTFTGTVSGITASMVGLGNVTNESKATMFTDPTFTGTVSGITATMVGLGNVTNESKATMFTSPTFTGTTTLQQITEVLNTKTTATGIVTHDFSTGTIFYHTSPSANFTIDFTNVPTTNDRTVVLTVVIVQGGTPYIANAIRINGGSNLTIRWLNGSIPSGTANQIDTITFVLTRVSSIWTVLASLSTFN